MKGVKNIRKIFLALIAVAFISSLCFAADQSAKADKSKTLIGKIESIKRVVKSSPPKWEHAILTVVADSGEKTIVYARKATVVTDTSGKDMSEGGKKFGVFSLKEGKRIELKYLTVKKGHNEAISIRCLD